ncbi:MAG: radical SAM protein [Candidatus Omnitrophica bacterium]|nr:radical SAM protein [Candidatus Omnitrophota bacterium]
MSEPHAKEYLTQFADTNNRGNVIRDTRSVCPICMKDINAMIIEKEEKVYLTKKCRIHGVFEIIISNNAGDYRQLQDCYFYLNSDNFLQSEYYLNASTACNMACPLCYLCYCQKTEDLTVDKIKEVSSLKQIKRFTLSHGEPTTFVRLFEIISTLKSAKKLVNIHTNGIKIAEWDYARKLKDCGIDHVSIQFDGFDDQINKVLRGQEVKKDKLKAIENLKALAVPVTLNATIARGVNEDQVGKIFDYSISNKNIKDISFITYSEYAPTKENMDKYIMPDDLINIIDEYTQGAISRRDIILFQKIFYAYCSVIKKRKCFYYYHYMVVRTAQGYNAISEYINLEKFSSLLEKFKKRKRTLNLWSFLCMLSCCLNPKSFILAVRGLKEFFRGGFPRGPIKLLTLTFASICDPYKYDAAIAAHCGQGIITDKQIHESYGTYLMNQMKNSENRI